MSDILELCCCERGKSVSDCDEVGKNYFYIFFFPMYA